MDENKIRQIVKDEMQRNYHSGTPQVPPHIHDGISNLKVDRSNVINLVGIMGNIDFASNDTYTLYFSTPNPARIDMNGFAFDNGLVDSSVLTVGMALLSTSYYFQPRNDRSASQGGLAFPLSGILAQCSSNLYVLDEGTTNDTFPHANQFFIMNARNSSTVFATMQLKNLTATSIDIEVTNLHADWRISANFIIS